MSVAYVLVLFTLVESSEVRSTLCIPENQKDLSSEKKNTQNMPSSPLGNSQSYTTDGLS